MSEAFTMGLVDAAGWDLCLAPGAALWAGKVYSASDGRWALGRPFPLLV